MATRWTASDVARHNTRVRAGRDRGDDQGQVATRQRVAANDEKRAHEAHEAPARYRLHVCHYVRRLGDVDGLGVSCKPYIDGIVDAGLLPDDSTEYIASVAHEQIQVRTADEERVVMTFIRTENGK